MNSRQKGARGERELAAVMQKHLPGVTAERSARCGVHQAEDILHSIPGVHVECKRVEKLNIDKAMAQAADAGGKSKIPTVWHRKNRGEWMVTIPLADLLVFCFTISSICDEVEQ